MGPMTMIIAPYLQMIYGVPKVRTETKEQVSEDSSQQYSFLSPGPLPRIARAYIHISDET